MSEIYEDDEIEIDLLMLLYHAVKYWWLILGVGAFCALAAFLFSSKLIVPKYQSTTLVYVLSNSENITSLADLQISEQLAEDYQIIAKSNPVLDGTVERLKKQENLDYTRNQIKEMLTVTNRATRILEVSVIGVNPKEVSLITNAIGAEIVEQMSGITKSDPPTIIQKAEPAESPVSPNLLKNTIIGGMAGVLVVLAALVLQFMLNSNIKSEEDVMKYLGLGTLAIIPENKKRERMRNE